MLDTQLAYFINNLPVAELHVHIEGTLEPELMFTLAQRNGLKLGSEAFPYHSVAEVRAAYQFSNLQDFLNIYYKGASVLKTEQDFYDLALAYFERANHDNIRHAEVFFDPQTHTDRGIPYSTVIEGLSHAAHDAEERFGMSIGLIHSFLRHLPESEAIESLKMAEPYLSDPKYHIIGIGLDSSEVGYPPSGFNNVFAMAQNMGLHIMAHAGEEGPPEYVHQALNILKVERIDHGNRSLEDNALVQDLIAREMTLTVCPLSNKALCVVPDLKQHPIPTMMALGLKATLNSDDPAYFGGYIKANFMALAELGLIGYQECLTLARNSFEGSFLTSAVKAQHLAHIKEFEEQSILRTAAENSSNLSGPRIGS